MPIVFPVVLFTVASGNAATANATMKAKRRTSEAEALRGRPGAMVGVKRRWIVRYLALETLGPGMNFRCAVMASGLGGIMDRGWTRLLVALVLVCGFAWPAAAGCNDGPGPGVDWSGCQKLNRRMGGDDFRGANLTGANLTDSDLAGADLTGANLGHAILIRTGFAGAILRRADLTKAILDRADLRGADLSGAQLAKAELHRADLSNARLAGSQMEGAELGRALLMNANFSGARLRNAYLARADLRKALLADADLREAELYLADLHGTDLSQARGLVQAQLAHTCGDDSTKLPPGLVPPPTWPCPSRQQPQ